MEVSSPLLSHVFCVPFLVSAVYEIVHRVHSLFEVVQLQILVLRFLKRHQFPLS